MVERLLVDGFNSISSASLNSEKPFTTVFLGFGSSHADLIRSGHSYINRRWYVACLNAMAEDKLNMILDGYQKRNFFAGHITMQYG